VVKCWFGKNKGVRHGRLTKVNGTPRGTRTPNLVVRSHTLYPIELWAQAKGKFHAAAYIKYSPKPNQGQELNLPIFRHFYDFLKKSICFALGRCLSGYLSISWLN
jgi:hypothetical protein